ncbi:methyl-accepting chemotaxis protein [Pseudaeromonas sharmana]|uniref:Methyl-accepting chemotaxis protein n=1 Tax=Pseudaeromonas sharmana TaxID=328412 RepID=A0ABV8CKE5_9GAMM
MNFIKDMKVRNKLFLAAGVLLALMLLNGGVAIMQLRHAEALTAEIRQTVIPGIRLAGQMESQLQRKRILVMRLVVADDEAEIARQEQAVQQLNHQMQQLWRQYQPLVNSQSERDQFQQFQDAFNEYDVAMGIKLMPAIRSGDRPQVKAVLAQLTPVAERQSRSLDALITASDDAAAEATHQLSEQNTRAMEVIGLLLALAVVIGGGCSLWLARFISQPLLHLVTQAQRVAAGDLAIQLQAHSRDEVGQMTEAFSRMVTQLRATLQQVSDNALLLATASSQLQGSSDHIATASEQVVAQSITVATAGEELVATTADIAGSCHTAADSSRQASNTTQAGMDVVRATVAAIRQRSEQTASDAEAVNALGKRSEQIGSIVATIQEIASQTNLLALNAAIEAARAGEQGRGFAVVADEVRALAARTTHSTQEISDMIRAIQLEARAATESMAGSVEEMQQVASEAGRLESTLETILSQVHDVNLQITQIATAAEEQSATTGEIASNMSQITGVVQDVSQAAEESASAANQLARMADEMKQRVSSFRL